MPMPEGDNVAPPPEKTKEVSSEGSPPPLDRDHVMADVDDTLNKRDEMPETSGTTNDNLNLTDKAETDPLKLAEQTRQKLTDDTTNPKDQEEHTNLVLNERQGEAAKNKNPEKGYENIDKIKTKGAGDQSGTPDKTDKTVKDGEIDVTPPDDKINIGEPGKDKSEVKEEPKDDGKTDKPEGGDTKPDGEEKPNDRAEEGDKGVEARDKQKDSTDPNDAPLRPTDGGEGGVDTPEAVKARFAEIMDAKNGGWGTDDATDRAQIKSFNDAIDVMAKAGASPEEYRALNLAMGANKYGAEGENNKTKSNVASDLAAKFEDVHNGDNNDQNNDGTTDRQANAFQQGKQGTCGTESAQRAEAKNDPTRYANEVAMAMTEGYAFRGGERGTEVMKVQVHESAFNGGDAESQKQYREGEKTEGGERGEAGRLGDYLRGQELADRAMKDPAMRASLQSEKYGLQDGDRLVYKAGGQGQTDDGEGSYIEKANGGADKLVTDSPLATDGLLIDMANANGRDVMVHESKRAQLGDRPGAVFFNNNNFNDKLAETTAKNRAEHGTDTGYTEHQTLGNGAYMLGRNEHGKHAFLARAGENGRAVIGNNWEKGHNNVQYSDNDMKNILDPTAKLPQGKRGVVLGGEEVIDDRSFRDGLEERGEHDWEDKDDKQTEEDKKKEDDEQKEKERENKEKELEDLKQEQEEKQRKQAILTQKIAEYHEAVAAGRNPGPYPTINSIP